MSSNPQAYIQQLMASNPDFQRFMQNNAGKTPQQIAMENGIDFNALKQLAGI